MFFFIVLLLMRVLLRFGLRVAVHEFFLTQSFAEVSAKVRSRGLVWQVNHEGRRRVEAETFVSREFKVYFLYSLP